MKAIKCIYTLMAAAVLAVSCEKAEFLNRAPYSQTSPENFYKTEADMRMALTSCYEVVNAWKIPGMSNTQRGTYAQGLMFIMNAPTDEFVAAPSSSQNTGLEMTWGNFVESTQPVREFWKCFYTGINRCNIILGYIDGINMDETQKNRFKAEARFMRAFFYYHLAWNFGGVPIVTDYASTGTEARSSLQSVYKFIFEDLKYAYENITTTGLIQNVSADQYTVAAYIGRICNYLAACKRYETGKDLAIRQPLNDFSWVDEAAMTSGAKQALQFVVDGSPKILIPDYTNLFRETTKTQQYQECLFLAELPLSGSEGYWPNSYYLPSPASNAAELPSVYGGYFVPTPTLFYAYDSRDPRRDHNCSGRVQDGFTKRVIDGYTYLDPLPVVDTVSYTMKTADEKTIYEDKDGRHLLKLDDGGYSDLDGNVMYQPHADSLIFVGATPNEPRGNNYVRAWRIYYPNPLFDSETQVYRPTSALSACAGKFRTTTIGALQHTHQQHAVSLPLMRLGDVYLMYAEALYFGGDEGTARQYLDKVLMRAVGNDQALFDELKAAYKRDDFVDELLESRMREMPFEFSRKWDLIRFNRIDEAIAALDATRLTRFDGQDIKVKLFKRDWSGKVICDPETGEIIFEEGVMPEELRENLLKFPDNGGVGIGVQTLQHNWQPHKIWLPISEEQIGVNPKLFQNADWGGNTGAGIIPDEEFPDTPEETPDLE